MPSFAFLKMNRKGRQENFEAYFCGVSLLKNRKTYDIYIYITNLMILIHRCPLDFEFCIVGQHPVKIEHIDPN